ncbi:MAG TPA: hypothetical protein VIT19_07000 [Pyrinomonadaceae bacterium]
MSNEITWGDAVIVRKNAPDEYRPGVRGSVCGVPDVLDGPNRTEAERPILARLYLVEFSDGEAVEIPEEYLLKEIE